MILRLAIALMLNLFSTSAEASLKDIFRLSNIDFAQPLEFNESWLHDFYTEIPVDAIHESFIPTHIHPPEYVRVFDFVGETSSSLDEVAHAAKYLMETEKSGALLFQNLHRLLHNESDFAYFWQVMDWDPVDHISCYNRKRKRTATGVDMVDTDVPTMTMGPHNEHACNPKPTARIAFYGLQPAKDGGESLIRRNADIVVPDHIQDFLTDHGGIKTTRIYPDHDAMLLDDSRHPTSMSWQERCATPSREECVEFLARHELNNITFTEDGAMLVDSTHTGFNGDGNFFNHLDYGFDATCADGTPFPKEYQYELKLRKWSEMRVYKLREGDWMVLNNLSVQHGRLPYAHDPEHIRKLIVTYTR